ncbi:YjfI family protein [Kaarinaea lacus]
MNTLQNLMEQVINLDEEYRYGLEFDYQIIKGEVDVAEVVIKDREELPIFLTIADDQMLCICYLWGEDEVKPSTRADMMQSMLDINIPMPLSSFARIGSKYVVFGAMSLNSGAVDVALELSMLSENALDAIATMSQYLI